MELPDYAECLKSFCRRRHTSCYLAGTMTDRHIDDGTSIHDFTDLFLVQCPKCSECAEVRRVSSERTPRPWQAKFCCAECATVQTGQLFGWSENLPVDWIFRYPLWLQADCCGQTLWAYNLEHLNFLESYIGAKHRVGLSPSDAQEIGYRNSTLASRLPTWMIAAKNRDAVLKTIRKLKVRCAT